MPGRAETYCCFISTRRVSLSLEEQCHWQDGRHTGRPRFRGGVGLTIQAGTQMRTRLYSATRRFRQGHWYIMQEAAREIRRLQREEGGRRWPHARQSATSFLTASQSLSPSHLHLRPPTPRTFANGRPCLTVHASEIKHRARLLNGTMTVGDQQVS